MLRFVRIDALPRKDGLDHGKQRYRCLSCGHRFTAVSGTELDNSKISYETVFSLVELIVYDLPLWVIAKIAGVNQKTARLWRFRVADAAVEYNDGIILEGKVWLDETYWRQTDKSMTFVGRGGLRLRGLSRNLVCVVIAYDCHGNYYASVLGKPGNPGSSEITSALKRHIARGSLVIP